MNTFELIRELYKRGIQINLDGSDNIRLRSEDAPLPKDLLEMAKERKPEIIAYLNRMTSLRVGMLVTCPNGVGRVWEVYPGHDRCGVLLIGETHPQFFQMMDVIPGNLHAQNMH